MFGNKKNVLTLLGRTNLSALEFRMTIYVKKLTFIVLKTNNILEREIKEKRFWKEKKSRLVREKLTQCVEI
jgi:hypothetical protein